MILVPQVVVAGAAHAFLLDVDQALCTCTGHTVERQVQFDDAWLLVGVVVHTSDECPGLAAIDVHCAAVGQGDHQRGRAGRPLDIRHAIAVLVKAIVPDLVCTRVHVRIAVVAVITTGLTVHEAVTVGIGAVQAIAVLVHTVHDDVVGVRVDAGVIVIAVPPRNGVAVAVVVDGSETGVFGVLGAISAGDGEGETAEQRDGEEALHGSPSAGCSGTTESDEKGMPTLNNEASRSSSRAARRGGRPPALQGGDETERQRERPDEGARGSQQSSCGTRYTACSRSAAQPSSPATTTPLRPACWSSGSVLTAWPPWPPTTHR